MRSIAGPEKTGVRAVRVDLLRAALLQHLGRLHQRAGGVDHVVHDHAVAALDLADDVHHFGDVGLRPALVDDRQVAAQLLGQRARAHHAADVGRDDDQVVVVLALQVGQQHRRGVDVVDRDVEEALDLVGVQVHRQHALDAHRLEQVGHHLGADRHARRARPAVLARVAEVRDHGGDALRADARLSASTMMQQLHQVLVGRRAGRLDDEHVARADVLLDLDVDFAVGEAADLGLAELDAEVRGDLLRQRRDWRCR